MSGGNEWGNEWGNKRRNERGMNDESSAGRTAPDKERYLLSALWRFTLVDGRGKRGALKDLSIELLEGDYPPVTDLVFRDEQWRTGILPWNAVTHIDRRRRSIAVTDFELARWEEPRDEILLVRDVLDTMILDLLNRRATRVNDLCLEEEGGRLLLRGADVGAAAVLRRLSLGLFDYRSAASIYDWKYVEFLRGDPRASGGGSRYYLRIARLPAAEIGRLSEALPYLHAAEVLAILPDALAAEVLETMSAERGLQVFEELAEDRALRLLELMSPSAAAALLRYLTPEATRHYLERLSTRDGGRQCDRLIELLRYPEDSVGGMMTNDMVFAAADLTVGEARAKLRAQLEEAHFTHFIYVVDDDENRRLLGALSLRDLIVTAEDRRLDEVMNPYLTTLNALEPARDGASKVLGSHLAALPVIGREGRLVGLLTISAVASHAGITAGSAPLLNIFS